MFVTEILMFNMPSLNPHDSQRRSLASADFETVLGLCDRAIDHCVDGRAAGSDIFAAVWSIRFHILFHVTFRSGWRFDMARRKNCDIAWERAVTIRGKNPRAWRRDDGGNRIRYGSFETRGKYAWTLQRGKPVSTTSHV
jgi:hypothetical protein